MNYILVDPNSKIVGAGSREAMEAQELFMNKLCGSSPVSGWCIMFDDSNGFTRRACATTFRLHALKVAQRIGHTKNVEKMLSQSEQACKDAGLSYNPKL